MPVGAGEWLGRVEEGNRGDHRRHDRGVGPQAADRQRRRLAFVAGDVARGLARVGEEGVPDPIDRQEDRIGEQPRLPQVEGPEKVDPFEVAEKQGRVADREEQAAAVADDEDEEHERVGDMLAFLVRLQERTDQKHGGAGRADEARHRCPEGEEGGVGCRRGDEIPLDPHAAGDDIEGEEEGDEGDVFGEQSNGQHRHRRRPRGAGRRRMDQGMGREVEIDWLVVEEGVVAEGDRGEEASDEELVAVVLPPVGDPGSEREDGDRR